MNVPDRQLIPPNERETESYEHECLRKKWNEYNQLFWDYWWAQNRPKMDAVRRIKRFIEFKMETA